MVANTTISTAGLILETVPVGIGRGDRGYVGFLSLCIFLSFSIVDMFHGIRFTLTNSSFPGVCN